MLADSLCPAASAADIASSILAATSPASRAPSMPVSTTRNSSPPKRPTVSDSRTTPVSRRAAACKARSPAPWPWLSLMRLKASRSTNSTPTLRSWRRAEAIAVSSRSSVRPRPGMPVNASRWLTVASAPRSSRTACASARAPSADSTSRSLACTRRASRRLSRRRSMSTAEPSRRASSARAAEIWASRRNSVRVRSAASTSKGGLVMARTRSGCNRQSRPRAATASSARCPPGRRADRGTPPPG